ACWLLLLPPLPRLRRPEGWAGAAGSACCAPRWRPRGAGVAGAASLFSLRGGCCRGAFSLAAGWAALPPSRAAEACACAFWEAPVPEPRRRRRRRGAPDGFCAVFSILHLIFFNRSLGTHCNNVFPRHDPC